LHQAQFGPGCRILILGDGPFGVLMARLANRVEGATVVIAGHHDERLAFATPTKTVNLRSAREPAKALSVAVGSGGYDAVILAVASRPAFTMGLEQVRAMGRLVVFAPLTGQTPVNLFDVLRKELTIVGAVNDQDRLDDAVAALSDPSLHLEDMITRRYSLRDYADAFRAAESDRKATMKVAFVFDEEAVGQSGTGD
jgi:threonine dehydrogenase-like Zn-dependent dehydrogenase